MGELTNQVDAIEDFLGPDLFAKLRTYCIRLTDKTVRSRSPGSVVDNAASRDALFADIENEFLTAPLGSFSSQDGLATRFKSYLTHKLD